MCVQHPSLQMRGKYSSQSLPHLRRVLRRPSSDQGVQHRVALDPSGYLGSSHTQMPHQETQGLHHRVLAQRHLILGLTGLALRAAGPLRLCHHGSLDTAQAPLVPAHQLSKSLPHVCTQTSVSWYHFPSEMISKGTHTSQQEEARPTCHNRSGLRSKSKTNGNAVVWREGDCLRKCLPRQGCYRESVEPGLESHAHASTCSCVRSNFLP